MTVYDNIFVKKYIPVTVPSNSNWYEKEELLIYINQLKYERFTSNPDKYLEKTQVINFDIINNRYRSDHRI